MSPQVLETLTDKLLKLQLPASQFCWQGGEPTLMGLEFFQKAIALQMQLGRNAQNVANTIQTNGLLIDRQWADFFARYRFLVGLSLDGPHDIHDRYRGKGTCRQVLAAIKTLASHAVQFNILTVVSAANEDRGQEVYSWLREQGFNYLQFIPTVETDDQGQPLPFSVSTEGYGRFMCQVFDAWLKQGDPGRVYIRWFESLLSHLASAPGAHCVLGNRCDHYLLIEHNGDVFPCDFFVQPDMRLGNILNAGLRQLADNPIRQEFARAKGHLPHRCSQCTYRAVCNGGCLKDRQRAGGSMDVPSYFCLSYKLFFAHALGWFKNTVRLIQGPDSPPPTDSTNG